MTRELKIGGQVRPIRFGMAALMMYEESTGRSALQDFARMDAGLVSVTNIVELVHCGLKCGYMAKARATGAAGDGGDFDKYDVADWLTDGDIDLEQVMAWFAESFPRGKNGTPPARKGKAAR